LLEARGLLALASICYARGHLAGFAGASPTALVRGLQEVIFAHDLHNEAAVSEQKSRILVDSSVNCFLLLHEQASPASHIVCLDRHMSMIAQFLSWCGETTAR